MPVAPSRATYKRLNPPAREKATSHAPRASTPCPIAGPAPNGVRGGAPPRSRGAGQGWAKVDEVHRLLRDTEKERDVAEKERDEAQLNEVTQTREKGAGHSKELEENC